MRGGEEFSVGTTPEAEPQGARRIPMGSQRSPGGRGKAPLGERMHPCSPRCMPSSLSPALPPRQPPPQLPLAPPLCLLDQNQEHTTEMPGTPLLPRPVPLLEQVSQQGLHALPPGSAKALPAHSVPRLFPAPAPSPLSSPFPASDPSSDTTLRAPLPSSL